MLWTMSPRPVCLQCHRPAANCYCHRIARIAKDWPVLILQDRREARSLSTLEAISAALSLLEGEPDRYQPMLKVMDWMADRQIDCMGETVYARNYPPEIS